MLLRGMMGDSVCAHGLTWPYAAKLNPVDRAWSYIKCDRIPNFTPSIHHQLRKKVDREVKRSTGYPDLPRSFIKDSALPPFLAPSNGEGQVVSCPFGA